MPTSAKIHQEYMTAAALASQVPGMLLALYMALRNILRAALSPDDWRRKQHAPIGSSASYI